MNAEFLIVVWTRHIGRILRNLSTMPYGNHPNGLDAHPVEESVRSECTISRRRRQGRAVECLAALVDLAMRTFNLQIRISRERTLLYL